MPKSSKTYFLFFVLFCVCVKCFRFYGHNLKLLYFLLLCHHFKVLTPNDMGFIWSKHLREWWGRGTTSRTGQQWQGNKSTEKTAKRTHACSMWKLTTHKKEILPFPHIAAPQILYYFSFESFGKSNFVKKALAHPKYTSTMSNLSPVLSLLIMAARKSERCCTQGSLEIWTIAWREN